MKFKKGGDINRKPSSLSEYPLYFEELPDEGPKRRLWAPYSLLKKKGKLK